MGKKRTKKTAQPSVAAQVPAAPLPPPMEPPADGRTRKLLTLQSVKRELADTIRKVKQRELDPKTAGSVIYGCSVLAEIIKGADVETLLKRLERRLDGGKPEETDGELASH